MLNFLDSFFSYIAKKILMIADFFGCKNIWLVIVWITLSTQITLTDSLQKYTRFGITMTLACTFVAILTAVCQFERIKWSKGSDVLPDLPIYNISHRMYQLFFYFFISVTIVRPDDYVYHLLIIKCIFLFGFYPYLLINFFDTGSKYHLKDLLKDGVSKLKSISISRPISNPQPI
jgi:hypothetical protein